MLRIERAEICTTALDTASFIEVEETTSFRPSMLYSVLPTVVSNHLPTIPSLRKSLNDVRNRGLHSKSAPVDELPQPETPPPGYSSMPPSGFVTPHRLSVALGEADIDFGDDASDRPGSSGSALPQSCSAHESSCGIRWKYANLGMQRRSEMFVFYAHTLQEQILWLKLLESQANRSVAPTKPPQRSPDNSIYTA